VSEPRLQAAFDKGILHWCAGPNELEPDAVRIRPASIARDQSGRSSVFAKMLTGVRRRAAQGADPESPSTLARYARGIASPRAARSAALGSSKPHGKIGD
jgi:hypothetical protein